MNSKLQIDGFGIKRWYNKNCIRHNVNGPAVILPEGKKFYIVDGIYCTDFLEYIRAVIEYKKYTKDNKI